MNLKHLNDKTLHFDLLKLIQQEREILCELLWHLFEIDKRKLYSDFKCGSLYEYCVKVLKYSEGQASRRVAACRFLIEFPEVTSLIQNGDINLTQMHQLKYFFKEENIKDAKLKNEILFKIKNKTTRETEKILWELKVNKSTRMVSIKIKETTHEILKKAQSLKACPDMDSLLLKMSAVVLKVWDPALYQGYSKNIDENSRFIPAHLKAYVWKRDKGFCTNCMSTFGLEIDHIKPFSAGGKTTPENLRLLCKSCNQRRAITYFNKSIPVGLSLPS